MVINDDELDSTDEEDEDEAEAPRGGIGPSSAGRDAGPYGALLTKDTDTKLSKPTVWSSPERWYDVEASCYVARSRFQALSLSGRKARLLLFLPMITITRKMTKVTPVAARWMS